MAQSGHHDRAAECPLLGVKRTSGRGASMSAFDPKRTSDLIIMATARAFIEQFGGAIYKLNIDGIADTR
jgi:hypothetical protein